MPEEIRIRVKSEADTSGLKETQQELNNTGKAAQEADKKVKSASTPKPAGTTAPAGFKPTIIDNGAVVTHGTTAEKETEERAKAAAGPAKNPSKTAKSASGGASSRTSENNSAAAFMEAEENAANEKRQAAEQAAAEKKAAVEAAEAERKAALAAKEREKEAKARAAIEKAAARQAEAEKLLTPRAKQELFTAGRMALEGESPMRPLGSAAGSVLGQLASKLGPLSVAIGGLVAAIGSGAIAGINAKDASDQEDKTIANRIRAERSEDRRHQATARSWRGSAQGSIEEGFSSAEKAASLKDQLPELEHGLRRSIWSPMRLLGYLPFQSTREIAEGRRTIWGRKSKAQRAIDKQKDDIERAQREADAAQKSAQMQWDTEGAIELDVKRDQALHSLPGMKQKRIHEAMLSWEREFKRVMSQTNNDSLATESANLKVAEEQKELSLRQASGLVNARSGAGDIAQAARLANASMMGADGWSKIDALHQTIKNNSREMNANLGKETFKVKPLHE